MKRISVFFGGWILAAFLAPTNVYATVELDFIDNFTTTESANTHQTPADPFANPVFQDIFGWDETPYLYLETPQRNIQNHFFDNAFVSTKWFFNSQEKFSSTGFGDMNQNEFFYTPPDWTSIRQLGLWTIESSYELRPQFTPGELTAFGEGSTQFTVSAPTVTPEPATMVLFGLGGAALALARKRRH